MSNTELDVLEDAGGALEAVARVDVRRRQVDEHVARLQVVRHEDEVVDLHDPVAVARPAVRVAARVLLAAVVEDLRALPARADLARLPEVVLAEPDDPLRRDPLAQPGGDRDRRPRRGSSAGSPSCTVAQRRSGSRPSTLGDPLPREVDRLVLVVVAEREVAHHLEERAVPLGAADLLEVGVLAARAQARLDADDARRRRLLRAQEVRLELLHAGADEQRREVLCGRDQRVAGHAQMPALLVEALERVAQLVRRHRHAATGYVGAVGVELVGARSPRGSSRARGGSAARRASARCRPAARSATASAPRRSAGAGSAARAGRAP